MRSFARYDLVLVLTTFIASVFGLTSVFAECRALAWVAIATADMYLFSMLLIGAMRSDDAHFSKRHPWVLHLFPRRTAGVFVVIFLILTIVSGFAGLYVGTNIFPSNKTSLDALYISFMTMGFSDFSPSQGYGQLVAIAQLASAILLLFGAFPLLISRISTFESTIDIREVIVQVDKHDPEKTKPNR
jgi:hypothetical protein